jgi:selenide, water dikinase
VLPAKTRVLLVGAGHVHLEILRRLALEPAPDLEVTIVSLEERHFYSGMTPGYLAGQYTVDDISSNVPAIARRAGAACVIGGAHRLDPAGRQVVLQDGRALPYDLLSFNIGSLLIGADDEDARYAERIKPLHRAARLKERIDAVAASDGGAPARVVIIGAGAGGVEVACATVAVLDRAGRQREITLVEGGDGVPAGYHARFQARTRAALDAHRVRLRLGVRGAARRPDAVDLDDGTAIASDLSIWLTGPQGAPLLAESGLPVEPRGFLWTDDRLRSTADSRVFAVGDCGTMLDHPRIAKSGVYAVRQAPILWDNLRAAARGRPLRAYRPQRDFLSILNTCDGRALLHYKGLISWSRWAWRLKDRIDRGFMRRYQRLAAG